MALSHPLLHSPQLAISHMQHIERTVVPLYLHMWYGWAHLVECSAVFYTECNVLDSVSVGGEVSTHLIVAREQRRLQHKYHLQYTVEGGEGGEGGREEREEREGGEGGRRGYIGWSYATETG